MHNAFYKSYANGESNATQFLDFDYSAKSTRKIVATNISQKRHSINPLLLEVINEQNSKQTPSPSRERNIAYLAEAETIAVICGQQVGLFLGPLFTFYKAATAIETARQIEKETGIQTVPIFWLQNEDHDYAEISHNWIQDESGKPLRLELIDEEMQNHRNRISVKHKILGSGIESLLSTIEFHFSRLPHSESIIEHLRHCYTPGKSISDAFAEFLSTLFAEEGLIIFDPRDARVNKLLSPVFRLALDSQEEITQALLNQSKMLIDAGYSETVHVRPDSPLFFFHPNGDNGPRFRLTKENDTWSFVGGKHCISNSELLHTLETKPLSFSTSALLRPIAQDYLFPTVASVNGPSEISYLAQVRPLYNIFDLPKSLVIPRVSLLCIEAKIMKKLKQLQLEISDIFLENAELFEKVTSISSTITQDPASLEAHVLAIISDALSELEKNFSAVDETLVRSLQKAESKIIGQIHSLKERYTQALMRQDTLNRDRLTLLQDSLFPHATHQERFYSAIYFLCRYGDLFKNEVFQHANPFSSLTGEINL